jgi:hypothetical protein
MKTIAGEGEREHTYKIILRQSLSNQSSARASHVPSRIPPLNVHHRAEASTTWWIWQIRLVIDFSYMTSHICHR